MNNKVHININGSEFSVDFRPVDYALMLQDDCLARTANFISGIVSKHLEKDGFVKGKGIVNVIETGVKIQVDKAYHEGNTDWAVVIEEDPVIKVKLELPFKTFGDFYVDNMNDDKRVIGLNSQAIIGCQARNSKGKFEFQMYTIPRKPLTKADYVAFIDEYIADEQILARLHAGFARILHVAAKTGLRYSVVGDDVRFFLEKDDTNQAPIKSFSLHEAMFGDIPEDKDLDDCIANEMDAENKESEPTESEPTNAPAEEPVEGAPETQQTEGQQAEEPQEATEESMAANSIDADAASAGY